MFSKRLRIGPWLVGSGNSFSSGNSRILIPFQGSVSVPIGTSGNPEGPADRIKRKHCEVVYEEGVDLTSRTFT